MLLTSPPNSCPKSFSVVPTLLSYFVSIKISFSDYPLPGKYGRHACWSLYRAPTNSRVPQLKSFLWTILFTTCSYIYKSSQTSKAVFKINSTRATKIILFSIRHQLQFISVHRCCLYLTKCRCFWLWGSPQRQLDHFIPLQSKKLKFLLLPSFPLLSPEALHGFQFWN